MATLKIVLTIVFLVIALGLIVVILMQEGKSAGLTGSISGGSDSFWERNRGRTAEGRLEKITRYAAIVFLLLAVLLNLF